MMAPTPGEERLRARVASLDALGIVHRYAAAREMLATIDALRAEVERLREAPDNVAGGRDDGQA